MTADFDPRAAAVASRVAQGLPETVTDPVVLARIAALVKATPAPAAAAALPAPYEDAAA